MPFINQADFARLHKVSRKTVTTWKKRGYIEVSGGLVDVERSNAKLAGTGRAWPQAVTGQVTDGAVEVTDNMSRAELWDTAGLHRETVLVVACMISPGDLAELLLRHVPLNAAQSVVNAYVKRMADAGSELLAGHEVDPPIGFEAWRDHPWFQPSLSDDDWAEYQAVAEAHLAGA